MQSGSLDDPLISVIVVGYRRLELLKETISTFVGTNQYPNCEYILCDDGSPVDMQKKMRTLPFDVFLLASKNEGLGRNTNKGIEVARGDYVFQLQDDWKCIGPADFIKRGLQVLQEFRDIGIVRFYLPSETLSYETRRTRSGLTVRVYAPSDTPDGNVYPYSDTPHLKRASLHQEMGGYLEGVPMTKMEIDFGRRFDAVAKWKVAYIEGYECFMHTGADQSFNPSVRRKNLRARLLANPLTATPVKLAIRVRKMLSNA